jgi:hypothetical protein
MSISIASFKVVSLIAMVPDSECRTPTLIVSASAACDANAPIATVAAAKPDLNTDDIPINSSF